MTIKNQKSKIKNPRAFTLVELLVVIGIIGVLVAILIPVIGKVRTQSHVADTKNSLNQLVSAIERYHNDFHAYPGPLPQSAIRAINTITAVSSAPPPNLGGPKYDVGKWNNAKISGTENLVLGLVGGLRLGTTAASPVVYDPFIVGKGPVNLNPANPKRYEPYFDTNSLSWRKYPDPSDPVPFTTGSYFDGNFDADDSLIPEFVDRFPESMPLLYMRARVGAQKSSPPNINPTQANNGVLNEVGSKDPNQQYDLDDIIAYTGVYDGGPRDTGGSLTIVTGEMPTTGHSIGQGKDTSRPYQKGMTAPSPAITNLYHGLRYVDDSCSQTTEQSTAASIFPFEGYSYLQNPANKNTPRSKDTFVLIAAGADRIYGTEDDITSFGDVK